MVNNMVETKPLEKNNLEKNNLENNLEDNNNLKKNNEIPKEIPIEDEVMLRCVESWVQTLKKSLARKKAKTGRNSNYVSPFHPQYIRNLKEISINSGIPEEDLMAKYKLAIKYRDKLVKKNENLVRSILQKVTNQYNCNYIADILYNVGLEALSKAVESYQSSYQTALSTYAYPKILNAMKRRYFNEAYPVDLPPKLPKTEINLSKAKQNIKKFKNTLYLSDTTGTDQDLSLSDLKLTNLLSDSNETTVFSEPETVVLEVERLEILNSILEQLEPSEKKFIDTLFGISAPPITINEYCKIHKISSMTVFRRKKSIFEKIKKIVQKNNIDINSLLEDS